MIQEVYSWVAFNVGTSVQDLVNGTFELFAGWAVLLHCRRLFLDQMVRGVSFYATAFFASWGAWNLYYYPWLGQMWSFSCGVFVFIANVIWTFMMVYYTILERNKREPA